MIVRGGGNVKSAEECHPGPRHHQQTTAWGQPPYVILRDSLKLASQSSKPVQAYPRMTHHANRGTPLH